MSPWLSTCGYTSPTGANDDETRESNRDGRGSYACRNDNSRLCTARRRGRQTGREKCTAAAARAATSAACSAAPAATAAAATCSTAPAATAAAATCSTAPAATAAAATCSTDPAATA